MFYGATVSGGIIIKIHRYSSSAGWIGIGGGFAGTIRYDKKACAGRHPLAEQAGCRR
jgi:hypothetical protein